eukprot:GFUD01045024.1.p1 GENE.GFUD01045024.1~~GFUD01045024.1.p1  ORF type:complete len:214 (-),score=67.52 GFUD01045024.1:591-1232(-)
MVSRYLHIRDWLVVLVVQLCLVRSSADYVWDGSEWKWQDTPANQVDDTVEGSADSSYGVKYGQDDDDDMEGSGRDDFESEDSIEDHTEVDRDVINVDEEIDPRDVDIGFHDESTPKPSPPPTPSTTTLLPTVPTVGTDPHKHHNQETNFFAQPGILAAVVGGTVVGLLCTILLVMLIVYRMRKADEGSYSLNEPKRSPNVHSYLKAPSREFFA